MKGGTEENHGRERQPDLVACLLLITWFSLSSDSSHVFNNAVPTAECTVQLRRLWADDVITGEVYGRMAGECGRMFWVIHHVLRLREGGVAVFRKIRPRLTSACLYRKS